MVIDSLHDLLVIQLRDLFSAETQITRALPKLARAATNEALSAAFMDHLAETEAQLDRLEQVFLALDVSPRGKRCRGMEGLLEEAAETIEDKMEPGVLDAGLIADTRRVEHYEIAAYSVARGLARQLGHERIVRLLDETLREELGADLRLAELAEIEVNPKAMLVGTGLESDD